MPFELYRYWLDINARKLSISESSSVFFIDLSDSFEYDMNWTENESSIDSFIQEILKYLRPGAKVPGP